jgi:hypothetical protein
VKADPETWLLLIHQVPNSPAYLRVKMWRRLQKIGAVAVKNAVYVLPRSDQSLEDFHWVAREIMEAGGDASVCEATFVEGITNEELAGLFQAAREADYRELLDQIKEANQELRAAEKTSDAWATDMAGRMTRLRQRLAEIQGIDFFECPAGKDAEAMIAAMEAKIRKSPIRKAQQQIGTYTDRTWVTRKGVHVDRIASAWLIRRFIDQNAQFKFVPVKGYRSVPGEVRFDMFDAEFTHEGDRCTFEVLIERFAGTDRALKPIGEIIHDIDLKDAKFGRAETAGFALVINAICTANKEDVTRIERGSAVFDDLYQFFKKR